MPEHPEIRAFVNYVNVAVCAAQFTKLLVIRSENVEPVHFPSDPFSVTAAQRGKQIKFTLNSPTQTTQIVLGLGLAGYFELCSQPPPDYIVCFVGQSVCLAVRSELVDSVYLREGDFDYIGRSPDPVQETQLWLGNLRHLQQSQEFICVDLLSQRYFNGVGNYLRCEILHRTRIKPTTRTCDVNLQDLGEELLSMLQEAFEVVSTPDAFKEWLQVYGKANNRIKVKGRTLWTWEAIRGERVPAIREESAEYLVRRADRIRAFMVALGSE